MPPGSARRPSLPSSHHLPLQPLGNRGDRSPPTSACSRSSSAQLSAYFLALLPPAPCSHGSNRGSARRGRAAFAPGSAADRGPRGRAALPGGPRLLGGGPRLLGGGSRARSREDRARSREDRARSGGGRRPLRGRTALLVGLRLLQGGPHLLRGRTACPLPGGPHLLGGEDHTGSWEDRARSGEDRTWWGVGEDRARSGEDRTCSGEDCAPGRTVLLVGLRPLGAGPHSLQGGLHSLGEHCGRSLPLSPQSAPRSHSTALSFPRH